MKKILILLASIALLTSCFEDKKAPIVPENVEVINTQTMDSVFDDTTKTLTVQLPILLDSANQILVHEVFITNNGGQKTSYAYSKKGKDYYEERINLIFEDQIKGKSYLLTDKQIQLNSYSVIARPTQQGNQGLIMYRVVDADYNNDGKIDYKDISSIYIGDITGTTFNKITKDREHFIDGKWLTSLPQSRYYFTSQEDSNKDGYFDDRDIKHYYYIQFNGLDYQIVEYNPLDMIVK